MDLLKMFKKLKYDRINGKMLHEEYVEHLTDKGDVPAGIDYQALARAILEQQTRPTRPDPTPTPTPTPTPNPTPTQDQTQTNTTDHNVITDTIRGITKTILTVIMVFVIVFAIGESIGLSIIVYLEYQMKKLDALSFVTYLIVVFASIGLIVTIIWIINRIKSAVDSEMDRGALVSFAALLLTIVSLILSIFGFWFNVIINVLHING